MNLSDALTITVLGMTVVFSGLLLTAGLIVALDRLQKYFDAPPFAGEELETPAPSPSRSGPVVDPEILTVITTVLEVERRLHRVSSGGARGDHR